jgi:hypothetical protein
MAREGILLMPGDWRVGDHVKITRGEEVLVSSRIKEIVGTGLYKIEVEEGGVGGRGWAVNDRRRILLCISPASERAQR